MTETLQMIHPWLGYAVSVLVLASAVMAFSRARDSREFVRRPYALTMVALDIQVTLGILLYLVGGYWDVAVSRPEVAYLHPVLSVLALAVGHASIGRAAKLQMAYDAHRSAGRGLLMALLLVFASIGVASAPPFL